MGTAPMFDQKTRISNALSHMLVRLASLKSSEAQGKRGTIVDTNTALNTPALHRIAHQTIVEYGMELRDPQHQVPTFDLAKPLTVAGMLAYFEQD